MNLQCQLPDPAQHAGQELVRCGVPEAEESAPDSGRLSGADDKVVGLLLLQHEPHAVHIVAGVAPVALRIHISQQQALLRARQQSSIICRSLPRT